MLTSLLIKTQHLYIIWKIEAVFQLFLSLHTSVILWNSPSTHSVENIDIEIDFLCLFLCKELKCCLFLQCFAMFVEQTKECTGSGIQSY